jgi:hypothetical protein
LTHKEINPQLEREHKASLDTLKRGLSRYWYASVVQLRQAVLEVLDAISAVRVYSCVGGE